ncbi:hypothetical protein H1220_06325 [Carnobacteriaceae bacterium zg-84]|nr:hypothetical protein [Granulicatella sp. zg-84]NEW66645.1 hypothetical protein [Granulicatella sp. zg-84]QMI85334.1 hypothetical protein H1220_06325 [Carnobacteriaceae bacterium zg-84]
MSYRKSGFSNNRLKNKKEPWLDGPKALVISTVITAIVEIIKHFLK